MSTSSTSITFLSSSKAAQLDQELMSQDIGYSIDQLMELAGLSVAQSIQSVYPSLSTRLLVICGPGNNGGDGLVAARHLAQFHYQDIRVVYPRLRAVRDSEPSSLYHRLVRQLDHHGVSLVETLEEALPQSRTEIIDNHSSNHFLDAHLRKSIDVIVDAIFGFGFKGDVRQPYANIISSINDSKLPVVAVDVPSGWDVDKGPIEDRVHISNPTVLVSLTAPKKCIQQNDALPVNLIHFLGGRFVPRSLIQKFNLQLPQFHGSEQIIKLS